MEENNLQRYKNLQQKIEEKLKNNTVTLEELDDCILSEISNNNEQHPTLQPYWENKSIGLSDASDILELSSYDYKLTERTEDELESGFIVFLKILTKVDLEEQHISDVDYSNILVELVDLIPY